MAIARKLTETDSLGVFTKGEETRIVLVLTQQEVDVLALMLRNSKKFSNCSNIQFELNAILLALLPITAHVIS
jgi:hypothetical protein